VKIYKNLDNFSAVNAVVTVGTFDGIHAGHQKIFDKLKYLAKKLNGESVVFTFWPHPRMVLDPKGDKVFMLNSIEEKIELIEKQGIDKLIIYTFNEDFSKLSYCDFVEKLLYQKIKMKGLIVGYDHKFGHDREGDFIKLKTCANLYGAEIQKVSALAKNGVNISSTLIRKLLFEGNIYEANKLLSTNFSLVGKVIQGKKLGRNLGFPTANIHIENSYKIVPKKGVYAVEVEYNNKKFYGMLNIGVRPTISESKKEQTIETHIFNFNHDIYNSVIKIIFYKRIRNEMKFSNVEELKKQLHKDKKEIESLFI